MASISVSAPLPAHSPFDATPDLPVPTKPIHTRRTSRNPNLAPLPAFTFNPGAMDSMKGDEQRPSPSAAGNDQTQTFHSARKGPSPLPAFSFNPGAGLKPEGGSSSPTHPILEEMAQNTSRRASRPVASPAFSFNPGGQETQKTPSPTKVSLIADPPTSARSTRHRRGVSEFVGPSEASQSSSTTLTSASPQKSALGPPLTGYGPSRTHQHRRSQAVSITEIETSELIKANAVAKHRAGSEPSSPTDVPSNDHFSRASQSISGLYGRTPPTSPLRRPSATGPRARVGFSDTVDVIPRPLSMISSETEGSTSTIRGNHSLTGSVTSFGSPAARSIRSSSVGDSSPTRRPRTADAVSPSQQRSTSMDECLENYGLPKRPLSASASTSLFASPGSPFNRKRFWFGGNSSNETSPKSTPKHTPTVEKADFLASLKSSPTAAQTPTPPRRSKISPERKASIQKRKVRTIAGAIFSRKTRSRGAQGRGRRTPTPPLSRSLTADMADTVFDEDHTVVIRNPPSPVQQRRRGPALNTQLQGQSPASSYDDGPDDRVTSPVIDLDAALGPFGSEEKLPQTGFAAARSRMHSSMGRGMTDAFGVMHRRAESAPQMPPINRNTFSVHRLGSNPNIAQDVFDEEEEDDFLAEENKPRADSDHVPEPDTTQDDDPSTSAKASNNGKDTRRVSPQPPVGLAISTEVSDSVEIVDVEDDITQDPARSSDSTLSAPVVPESEIKHSSPSTMHFAYPAPQTSYYASSGEGRSAPGSAMSSPDADHLNFDNYPRFSRHTSEPSPSLAIRSSTEDVPSLCDSVSTGNAPRVSSGAVTRSSGDQRSSSFCAPSISKSSKTQQAWKRASLASLNRLIPGSSHGEKSRLRYEETAKHEQEEKIKKRGNRISRLMSFWRAKEKENK